MTGCSRSRPLRTTARLCVSMLAVLGSHLAFAHGILDMRPLAECLDGWGIQWRLPYYPRLALGSCKQEKNQAAAALANAPERRVTAAMSFSAEGFPALPGERGRFGDAPDALYAHFDRLLTGQGFLRVEGPVASQGGDPHPESAAYERATAAQTTRVELSMRFSHAIQLVLESRGSPQDAARLGAPRPDFDITAAGVHGPLFALPGTRQVSERLVWDQQDFPEEAQTGGARLVWVPAREFRYDFAARVTPADALSAWQVALQQAGWTPAGKMAWPNSTKAFAFKLPDRSLEVGLSAFEDRGVTRVTATVVDPAFWREVIPVLGQMEWAKPWEFAPRFDAAGKPTETTRRQLFALSGWTRNGGPEKLYVVPVVAQRLLTDPASIEKARVAARWMRDEILRVGVFHGTADAPLKTIDIHPDVRAASAKSSMEAGARVTYLYCRNVTETRPGGDVKSCTCRFDQEILSARPGACAP